MLENKLFSKIILLLGDVFLMYAALLLALAIRFNDFSFLPGSQTKIFIFNFFPIHLLWILILIIFDFYKNSFFKKNYNLFQNIVIFFLFAGATGTIYFYLQPQLVIAPKTILFLDVLIFSFFLYIWRFLFSQFLRIRDDKEKIVIIGTLSNFSNLLTDSLKEGDYQITAFYDPNFSKKETIFSSFSKYGVISDIFRLKEIIEEEKIKTISFSSEFYKDEKIIREVFLNLPPNLNFISFADFYEDLTKKVSLEAINELWFLENISRVERKINEILKRVFDIFFSLLGFLITLMLFPFMAILIKLDSPGPIFFLQKRVGRNRKLFNLYKYRTMKADSNREKDFWREKDESQITSLGNILRRFYLDELPQFLNILKGDISFVGPRPEWVKLAEIFEKEIPFYSFRYIIRPGLTGWAQLNFPASTSVQEAKEKFQYDLYYIKNRSFFFDLEIIFKTLRLLFK